MDITTIFQLDGVLVAGLVIGVVVQRCTTAKRLGDANELAKRIVEEARKEAQAQKKEILVQGQNDLFNQKREMENEFGTCLEMHERAPFRAVVGIGRQQRSGVSKNSAAVLRKSSKRRPRRSMSSLPRKRTLPARNDILPSRKNSSKTALTSRNAASKKSPVLRPKKPKPAFFPKSKPERGMNLPG